MHPNPTRGSRKENFGPMLDIALKACIFPRHVKEDIEILEQIRMDSYRWKRIFPNGIVPNVTPNADAIAHCNELIDLLLEKGIEPHVTLWARDHPQALKDEYHGLLSTRIMYDFLVYANGCFSAFDDRVKFWITLDEPNDYASLAYASTQSPPGCCNINILSYLTLTSISRKTKETEGPYWHSSLVQMLSVPKISILAGSWTR
ncbi:hypothetical protein GOP47_0014788 [Adiantum capillus-veneris]|uniref:Uncharacterized protein n=1 Tax=Adiantum capillus-veneris TaxID=13818 RepID=A0A9D4UMD7_ADICA|nr:hypothetical protein GOP47_0014788 [Adiantum capillus-veneris]